MHCVLRIHRGVATFAALKCLIFQRTKIYFIVEMSNPKSRKQVKTNIKSPKGGRKRNSKSSGKHSPVWLLVAFCVAVVYLFFNKTEATPTPTDETAVEAPTAPSANTKKRNSTTHTELANIDYEAEALPEINRSTASKVLYRRGYTVSFNYEFRQPDWVCYELLRSELNGSAKRKDFQPDPDLGEKSSQLSDYRNSGYDRGHLAPAADFSWDETAMTETFYLSNISPQGHEFNAGIWLTLENKVRDWAKSDSAICIVAGPVLTDAGFPKQRERLRKSKVVIPQYFYKVILAPFGDKPKAIGFIMPNKNSQLPLSRFAVTVDSVETLTGIDFFSVLPDKIEQEVESSFNLKDWNL